MARRTDLQHFDALRNTRLSKKFEQEVPLARGLVVWKKVPVNGFFAAAPVRNPKLVVYIHSDLQWLILAPFEARFDEASTILTHRKNGGPCLSVADQPSPPVPTNMRQAQEGVQVFSGFRRCYEFEYCYEDLRGQFGDGGVIGHGGVVDL